MLQDLKSVRLMKLKALLFLVITGAASALLLIRTPELSSLLLLGVALWAACRAYYFAFYVLEHYVDPTFRYSGLGSLVWHLLKTKRTSARSAGP